MLRWSGLKQSRQWEIGSIRHAKSVAVLLLRPLAAFLFGKGSMVTTLFEQYRPSAWAEVIGQAKAERQVRTLARRGLAGRAYWISGASGTGKTTIARILAAEVAGADDVEEVDASDLTPRYLKDMERRMRYFGWGGKGGRAYLVNEAHGLRRDTIRQLLVLLERLPRHVVVIFTTTCDGQEGLFADAEDAGPLLSRCVYLPLARRNLAKRFASRAQEIAQAENLDGRPLSAYVALVRHHRNNFRAVLQDVEAGRMLAEDGED